MLILTLSSAQTYLSELFQEQIHVGSLSLQILQLWRIIHLLCAHEYILGILSNFFKIFLWL
ncbi:hypothetical protein MUK42_36710 [Musa troglodytarum]|uniref:Uncharacterized protein n=1 Tax=Musa troglodytarum TaxID=320322 RepID=A0A9E7JC96_9LILI|nr:hypothetical protein MUK42_36710 [Musa troglodytarum]